MTSLARPTLQFAIRCRFVLAVLSMFAVLAAQAISQAQTVPPATERHEVTEVFFGQTVTDPYRWLENWRDGQGAEWLKAQDTYTRAALTHIPGREKFLQRVKALDTASTRVRNAQVWGGKLFYLKADPGADNVKLYVKDKSSSERLLFDPELLTKDGVHYSIDYYPAVARWLPGGLRTFSRRVREQRDPHSSDRDGKVLARCNRPRPLRRHSLAAGKPILLL